MNSISTNSFISVVIPVYKGEATIGRVVNELINTITELFTIEIILVNDNSPDDSEHECIRLYHQFQGIVRFFSLSKNVGEHNAVMAGLNKSRGDFVVIMDDDFQNPITEVKTLINAAINNKNDVIYTYYEKKEHSRFRNFGSWFNDKVANIMLNKPRNLYLSSFKILNRFIVDEIIKYDLPYPYIDGLILRTTDKVGVINVKHQKREIGESGYTLKKLVSLWLNMFVNFSILPLRIATIIGFLFSLFGLVFAIITFVEKILNPELPVGWATITIFISIFAGIQLIALGMIGEYVGRIFLSQNKKPQYTIKKSFE
ncbi:MAG: glycosyltransferase family 2 protein [Spirochaetota bacterium]|nr:glycosyltransferase family 2 protein [Spirochaetota bacterium]